MFKFKFLINCKGKVVSRMFIGSCFPEDNDFTLPDNIIPGISVDDEKSSNEIYNYNSEPQIIILKCTKKEQYIEANGR